jgi:hypothetical protein
MKFLLFSIVLCGAARYVLYFEKKRILSLIGLAAFIFLTIHFIIIGE